MGISLASASRGLLPLPHTLSSTSCGAHVLICCRGHRPLVVSSLPHTHSLIYQPWCSCAHLLLWTSASRGLPPHTLSHLPAVGLMRSSAVVSIGLLWSAPSLTHSLIYQPWCSCAHLLLWTSSSRGLLPPPHTLSSTSCGAHALICCRGHRPLVVCSLSPHTLSHLPAVMLMRSSAVVDIVPSRFAPSLTDSLIYQPWCSCAHLLSWASSSRGLLPPPRSLIY